MNIISYFSGCKRPDMKKNAILRGNMYSVGDKIEYECKEGFNKTTPKPMTSVCLENGSWSTVGVECLPGWYFGFEIIE
jgi:hypothetical protein